MSWGDMTLNDLYTVRDNKEGYGNTTDKAAQDAYNTSNRNIRAGYGISESDDISLGELNKYIAAAERQEQKYGLLTNITAQANKADERAKALADAIRNFRYDPNSDPAYKSYVDMYNRQGASAAKSTLNELNSASMGRNNSFSSAATAQVQQAYAQKATEIIPTLAEQAYNKLLQQYNIARDMADNTWNKQLQAYQTLASDEAQNIVNEGNKINNQAAQKELNVLGERLAIDLENGRLQNIQLTLANENMTYEKKIKAIATEIQEKYGLPMAEAEYQAQLIANQKKLKM